MGRTRGANLVGPFSTRSRRMPEANATSQQPSRAVTDLDGRAFIRHGTNLIAADMAAADWLKDNVKDGREVIVTIRKARNPKHLRKVFALLQLVLDNTEGKWSGTEDLL